MASDPRTITERLVSFQLDSPSRTTDSLVTAGFGSSHSGLAPIQYSKYQLLDLAMTYILW